MFCRRYHSFCCASHLLLDEYSQVLAESGTLVSTFLGDGTLRIWWNVGFIPLGERLLLNTHTNFFIIVRVRGDPDTCVFKHSCFRKRNPAWFLTEQFIFTPTHLYTQKCLEYPLYARHCIKQHQRKSLTFGSLSFVREEIYKLQIHVQVWLLCVLQGGVMLREI